jgi:myo-inositol catabolism protein IolC
MVRVGGLAGGQNPGMAGHSYRPSPGDPLFILAMDHRASFGKSLFGVADDRPDEGQRAAMEAAKRLIYAGLAHARAELPGGRAGVLVDERYGQPVIDAAHSDGVILAVPVERSGRERFELEWGQDWLGHVASSHPDFAKVLVRDNPGFPAGQREEQLRALREVSDALGAVGVPLLYELLVPATDEQRAAAGGVMGAYDRDMRPGLVMRVIADNQAAGVEPAIWKVEGLETGEAARAVVSQIRAGGRDGVCAIVLGRDAPAARLDHWLAVAAPVDGFVGFAIGRSIWEDPIAGHNHGRADEEETVGQIAERYLGFARQYCAAGAATPGRPRQ